MLYTLRAVPNVTGVIAFLSFLQFPPVPPTLECEPGSLPRTRTNRLCTPRVNRQRHRKAGSLRARVGSAHATEEGGFVIEGSQMAERIGNRTIYQKVTGSNPSHAK